MAALIFSGRHRETISVKRVSGSLQLIWNDWCASVDTVRVLREYSTGFVNQGGDNFNEGTNCLWRYRPFAWTWERSVAGQFLTSMPAGRQRSPGFHPLAVSKHSCASPSVEAV